MKTGLLRAVAVLTLVALIGGGGAWIDAQRAKKRSTLSGFFESLPTDVSSRIGGRVARIDVREGDATGAGQIVVELEAAPNQDEAAARRFTAEQARQALLQAQNGPRAEDVRKQALAVEEQRAAYAKALRGPRPEEIEAARAGVRAAEARLRQLRNGARPQEVAQARAAERNAQARLDQVRRGLTPEEKEQARARLAAAVAQEDLARRDADRMTRLFSDGAISRQQLDTAQSNQRQASARRQELAEALKRAEEGTPREELEQAAYAHQQAKAALDLVLAGARPEEIQAAAAALEQARMDLRIQQKGTRPEDLDAAKARLEQAEEALAELRAGTRREEVAQLAAARDAAAAQARQSAANVSERVVRAPVAGTVDRVLVAEGDLVQPGAPVLRILTPADVWIRVYVPESSLGRVAVGMDADLRLDTGQTVPGVVESIASRGEFTPANLQTPDERGKQVFAVRVRPRRPDGRIKAGMFATVTRIGAWRPGESR